jgi:hypothetical protein
VKKISRNFKNWQPLQRLPMNFGNQFSLNEGQANLIELVAVLTIISFRLSE